MSTIESICVYCASGPGNNPAFMDTARKLGRILAENGIRLVYGGGSVGLMGALAESGIHHGGGGVPGNPGGFCYPPHHPGGGAGGPLPPPPTPTPPRVSSTPAGL